VPDGWRHSRHGAELADVCLIMIFPLTHSYVQCSPLLPLKKSLVVPLRQV
jgi:hypothetical protein